MKILILTARLPFPPIGGDKVRIFNVIKQLSMRHQVTLLSFVEDAAELKQVESYRQYFCRLRTVELRRNRSYLNCLQGMFSREPLQVHYYKSSAFRQLVHQELQQDYDAVLCHLIRMGQYLPSDNRLTKVVDFTDALSLNYLRSQKYRRGVFSIINRLETSRVHKYELGLIRRSDKAIFISPVDANFVRNPVTHKKLHVVRNGVDTDKINFFSGTYEKDTIVFLGNMRTFPNQDAVEYFVHKVFPILKSNRPQLKFYIVGTQPNRTVQKLHNGTNVIVTGFVPDVRPYLHRAAAMVVPMRVGAGIQNKILEAMSAGTPVVATTIAAEGLDATKMLIGDSPAELAARVETLLLDSTLRTSMAVAGRQYVEGNLSWQCALASLERCLKPRDSKKEPEFQRELVTL